MVNDRGSIKWETNFMMPEHTKMLEQVFKEQTYKDKPMLDDQQKLEINLMLQLAVKDDLTTQIKYFSKRDFHILKGKIIHIDVLNGRLKLLSDDGMYNIVLDDILEVVIL